MTTPTVTKVLGINDAKISPITQDDATALVYGASVDVPGVTALKMSPKLATKDLKGDEKLLDSYTKLESISIDVDSALVSLSVLSILLGGTVDTATPGQAKYSLTADDRPGFWKLEGQSTYSDAGDIHCIFYRCKATKCDWELKGEDYAQVSFSAICIPTIHDGKIKDVVVNDVATAIV